MRKVLCIRLDNMGDLLMSSPAMRALKESFNCSVTLLTSSQAAGIVPHLGIIDETIVADTPWVQGEGGSAFFELVKQLKAGGFDAAVIFTVFSQNPMPAIMLAYLAGIPLRLAYCRENPYELLTHWIPEQEPYSFVRHQVIRDLELVASVGACAKDQHISISLSPVLLKEAECYLLDHGVDLSQPWMIVHPCASEKKRQYPVERLREIVRGILDAGIQVVVSGTSHEKEQVEELIAELDGPLISVAGALSLDQFAAAIQIAPLLLSVNSGPVHIASATGTPVIVLYALTNTQHVPWMVKNEVFFFPVEDRLKSRNEVLRYVDEHLIDNNIGFPEAADIIDSVRKLLRTADTQRSQPEKNQVF